MRPSINSVGSVRLHALDATVHGLKARYESGGGPVQALSQTLEHAELCRDEPPMHCAAAERRAFVIGSRPQ